MSALELLCGKTTEKKEETGQRDQGVKTRDLVESLFVGV